MTIKLLGADGKERTFSFLQAEALLQGEAKMKHGNWFLPENSNYEFKNNGLIRRTNKRANTGTTKKESPGQSEESRKQANDALRDNSSQGGDAPGVQ